MIGRFFFLCFAAALAVLGFGLGSGQFTWKKGERGRVAALIQPEREAPLTEYKSFAIVLHAYNDLPWCERTLRSIFAQDYDHYRLFFIDDGSTDDTYAKVEQFVVENEQQHRVVMMKNEKRLGPVGSLYRAVEQCLDREIVFPCSARDWLPHPSVLTRLNRAYQNPDVWAAFGQSIQYPSYELDSPPEWNLEAIEKEGYGEAYLSSPFTFYAAVFKQIPLSQLFHEGLFNSSISSYRIPLLELSGGRFKSLKEPIAFENLTLPGGKPQLFDHPPQKPLTQFPPPSQEMPRADILLFSFNRPLQLYATLESIARHVTGFEKVTVLYRTSDERFEAGYAQLRQTFPFVQFIRQGEDPRKDFKPLLLSALFDSPSQYVLFGVDDLIVKDEVDLAACMEAMEKTQAYGFYLRFGQHIQHCYQKGKPQEVPPSVPLAEDLYAWDLKRGAEDWGFANNLDMTLYRKKDLKHTFETSRYKNPNSLESAWDRKRPEAAIGLYFDRSKVVNIPLNVLSETGNPHMNYLTAEELLVKFNQRLKIDIDPLYQVENPSPHYEYTPDFIPR